jgi:hypothetical protein
MLRYGIALGIAALVILAGVVFVRLTDAALNVKFEQQRHRWKQQKADGTLPEALKDVDLDAMRLDNVGMTVTPGMQLRLDWAGLLTHFWYVLIPLTIGLCLGVAYLVGRYRPTQS